MVLLFINGSIYLWTNTPDDHWQQHDNTKKWEDHITAHKDSYCTAIIFFFMFVLAYCCPQWIIINLNIIRVIKLCIKFQLYVCGKWGSSFWLDLFVTDIVKFYCCYVTHHYSIVLENPDPNTKFNGMVASLYLPGAEILLSSWVIEGTNIKYLHCWATLKVHLNIH